MNDIEWKDVERMEGLLRSKSYSELSNEEVAWISQWIDSSHEYEMLQKSEDDIRQYFQDNKIDQPSSKILSHLTNHLRTNSAKQLESVWWQFKPSFSALLLAMIFGLLGWWAGHSTNAIDKSNNEDLEALVVRDTIYIASKPDTVFTEKVVYRDRTVFLTQKIGNNNSEQKATDLNGINMKEKEELEKLLVSGRE